MFFFLSSSCDLVSCYVVFGPHLLCLLTYFKPNRDVFLTHKKPKMRDNDTGKCCAFYTTSHEMGSQHASGHKYGAKYRPMVVKTTSMYSRKIKYRLNITLTHLNVLNKIFI